MRGGALDAASTTELLARSVNFARTGEIDSNTLTTLLNLASELVAALTHRQTGQPRLLDLLAPSAFALLPTSTELELILSHMAAGDVACLALTAKTLRATLPGAVQTFWDQVTGKRANGLDTLSSFLCSPARVQWAIDHGVTDACDACAACAMSGRLDLLQLLHAAGANARWGSHTMVTAAAAGHLDVLQWLAEHGCAWDACVVWHPLEDVMLGWQPGMWYGNPPPSPPSAVIECVQWAVLHQATASPDSAQCSSPDSAFLNAIRYQ